MPPYSVALHGPSDKTDDRTLANAQLVLPDRVARGAVTLRGGLIAEIREGTEVPPGAEDCCGDILCPGLIELHTDNLERHLHPRPGVDWPHRAAIVAHDREMAGAGITTVYDAIRVGSILSDRGRKRYGRYARRMADEILEMRGAGALGVSHHIHLRAEICSETLLEELDEFGPADRVGIVSLMDHTPGQRQFRDVSKFEDYVCGKNGLPRDGFVDYVDYLYELQATLGPGHEAGAVAAAQRCGAVLASHDDTTAEQVATSRDHGVRIAEFPTTREAASACRAADIGVIMGAPNLVRGGSHSGNVAAAELGADGLIDILSSDYVPAALLMGALALARIWDDLPRAIGTVTAAPARAVGLTDRGTIAPGLRADLVRFATVGGAPVIRGVWAGGRQVG